MWFTGKTKIIRILQSEQPFRVLTNMANFDKQANNDYPGISYLCVSDVASILSVSDDTVLKQFGSLEGVIDIGTPATVHKRRKRVLRIPRRTLERYISDRQVRVRRSESSKNEGHLIRP
jgi:hypothetical protein